MDLKGRHFLKLLDYTPEEIDQNIGGEWYIFKEEAIEKFFEIVPKDHVVSWGGTCTMDELELKPMLKEKGYEVASYSGYTFEELLEGTEDQKKLLELIDILIDGRFLLAEKSLEIAFRGSRNQRILDVKKSLAAGKAVDTASKRWLGEY